MKLWQRVVQALGVPIDRVMPNALAKDFMKMRNDIERARVSKFNENYQKALNLLDQAELAAGTHQAGRVAIGMHRAEIYIRLRRWDEANHTLDILEREINDHPAVQIAYARCFRGMLAQAQGDWETARTIYEEALTLARESHLKGVEGRALGHLADTYLHEGNASYAVHLLRDCLARLNESADYEMSSYFAGLLGLGLIASGQEEEGYDFIERALQIAEHMKHFRYQRQWLLVLGERSFQHGHMTTALVYFVRAEISMMYVKDLYVETYIKVLCALCRVNSVLRDTNEALVCAVKAIEMSESHDPALRSMAYDAYGTALKATGQHDRALEALQMAISLQPALDDAETLRTRIKLLRTLAAVQVTLDHDAAPTYQQAQALVETLKRVDMMNGSDLERAQVQRDMGLMHAHHGDHQAALEAWAVALAFYEERHHYAEVARLYCDMGNARRKLGMNARAMKDFEQALMVLNSVDEQDDETRGVVYANAAILYADQGDAESADAFFADAIACAKRVGDPLAESRRMGNYGWFLVQVGRPRRAIGMLEAALTISRNEGYQIEAALQLDNLGLAYDALADYPAASSFHQQATKLADDVASARWRALFRVNGANTLMMQGDLEGARAALETARELVPDEAADREVHLKIGIANARLAIHAAQFDAAAFEALSSVIAVARRYELRRLLAQALHVQSEWYAKQPDPDLKLSAAAWDEALRFYQMMRMPQAKNPPAWLAQPQKIADA